MNSITELKCQIIPMESGNLLVPDRLVAEVVVLEESDTQQSFTWRNRIIPIFQNNKNDKLTKRVTVLRTVMGYPELPFIAISSNGIPHELQVSQASLKESSKKDKDCELAASYSRIGSLDCMIPDLPKIEAMMYKEALNKSNPNIS